MSELVKLNGKGIPADVLDWILDCFWTGTESENNFRTLFEWGRLDEELSLQWNTLCSLSRTSHLLRTLCLPRMTGTLYFDDCETIGKFWRAIQLNKSLGSFTHTCYFKFHSKVWPWPLIPSEGIEKMFEEGDLDAALAELAQKQPKWSKVTVDKIQDKAWIGPDGNDFDKNITNPKEFKQALLDITLSWTRIKSLHWSTAGVPLLTEIIEHVEQLGTLKSLSIHIAACEERYYLPESSSSDVSQKCTPLWRLTQQISEMEVSSFGFSGHTLGQPEELDEEILNPQLDVLEKALQKAKQVGSLRLRNFCYPGGSHSPTRFDEFLRRILFRLACIPKIELSRYVSPEQAHLYAMQALYPQIQDLSTRKHHLEASDIQALGKKASEEESHPLAPYSHLLQKEGVAESISKEWNEKYAPS